MTAVVDDASVAAVDAPPMKARRLKPAMILSYSWLITIVLAAVFADLLPLADPAEIDPRVQLASPSWDHPLGTDGLGRDQLSRVVHGAQVSVFVTVVAVGVGILAGGLIGVLAGHLRGRFEGVVMAVSDVVLAFPGLILLLVLLAYVGRSLATISLIIGILSIPLYARIARANTLSVSENEYVRAAKLLGAKRSRIVMREVVPNLVLPITAFGFVAMGRVIVLEGSLAFLGLSVEPPDPTWGQMIADSKRHLTTTVWPAITPSVAMFLTVLALSLVGDRLRHRIDVRGSNV